jgi:nicotinamide-nucleotide amidase
MKAEIITIGDELLIGQVIDTNSAWIGQHLNSLGISLYQRTACGDNKEQILACLNDASLRSDIIILTGATAELFVILTDCTLLVTNVPAPGTESMLNIVVTEPVGTFKIILST